ncbi:conjugal transfer protein [Fannyhessea vaginae]|uniref:Helicase n=1 Tax=Fannyhessea vaginae DSM 15829 TaxID=525256 RepID=F1T6K9_9ACTN|nr:hypothetical protein HMPREF0091_11155 [Fannyhessea vaginae DSM 15829]QPR42339.1 conjugal transfer protein [Fannyhessea vaginae]
MTSKTPVRVAEDVDESSLNYAELKALTTGNPKIKKKVDLDNEVTKLKMLQANYKSNRYRLEEKVAKNYPEEIARTEKLIEAVKKDISEIESKPEGEEKFTSITIGGEKILDKKLAGEKLLETISKVKINESKVIGQYRHMDLEVSYNFFANEHNFSLNDAAKHSRELGTNADRNIIRLDNALEKMPEQLKRLEEKLIGIKEQLENAEEELKQAMGPEIDDEGNFYDPLSKDLDNDGIADRYDNDFKDSDYFESTYDVEDNLHTKEEAAQKMGDKPSILGQIKAYQEESKTEEKQTAKEQEYVR